jgi:sialidase-1
MEKKLLLFFLLLCGIWSYSHGVELEQKRIQVPVLKLKTYSPVLKFRLLSEHNIKISELNLEFEGSSNVNDFDSIFVFKPKENSWYHKKSDLIYSGKIGEKNSEIVFSKAISSFNQAYVLALKIKNTTKLHNKISIGIKSLTTENGKLSFRVDPNRIKQRVGVAVRKAGDDNVSGYRIPGLARTNKGSLLAIYDARRDTRRDLQGNIDIGVSRSTDGGQTWEAMRIGLDMGEYGGLPEKFNGVSDACILVDKNSDAIYLAGCWMHGVIDGKTGKPVENLTNESKIWNHQWRHNGSLQGKKIENTSQFIISKSTDDGKTWGKAFNITNLKEDNWHLYAPAPGSGITLEDGTLVIPSQGKDDKELPFSNITFSKDGGKTWHTSKASYSNTTENMVVQLSDGSIMQNMRDNRNGRNKSLSNGRAIFTTNDLGKTWKQHSTHHGALQEPVCMASIYKHEYITKLGEKKSILLFSNPNSRFRREAMTIKVSFDDGKTWPLENQLLLDQIGLSGGYSSLTSINNNTIGILYEGSQAHMCFESIDLEEFGILDAKKKNLIVI